MTRPPVDPVGWPHTVAYALERASPAPVPAGSGSHTAALDNAIFAYGSLLRFVSLVLVSDFLQGERDEPRASRVLPWLAQPHLNQWYEVPVNLVRSLWPRSPAGASTDAFAGGLVEAVHAYAALREGLHPLHNAILDIRNGIAHGGVRDEEQSAAQLATITPLLRRAFEAFGAVRELTPLVALPSGIVRAVGPGVRGAGRTLVLPAAGPLSDELRALLRRSDVVVVRPDGRGLAMLPLLRGPRRTAIDNVYAFDGAKANALVYLGVADGRREDPDGVTSWRAMLRAKRADPGFTRDTFTTAGAAAWARWSTREVLDNLRGVKYFPDTYVERRAHAGAPGVDDDFQRFLAGSTPALLVLADPGLGKTSLLCRAAEQLAGGPDAVVLLLGGDVRESGTDRLFARIRTGLGLLSEGRGVVRSFEELVAAWSERGTEPPRLVLLVDAVNESADLEGLLTEVGRLAKVARMAGVAGGRVRLVVSMRRERFLAAEERWSARSDGSLVPNADCFAAFQDPRGRVRPWLELRPFLEDEACTAYEHSARHLPTSCRTPWQGLPASTRALLHHPLLLWLFHGAFGGGPAPEGLRAENALWSAWLERVFDPRSGGEWLRDRALDLAERCLRAGAENVPDHVAADVRQEWAGRLASPAEMVAGRDPIERLADAGLLRRTMGAGWDWVSDSLASELFSLAFASRAPHPTADDFADWLASAGGERTEGALVLAASRCWEAGAIAPLVGLAPRSARGRAVVGRCVAGVAPRGAPEAVGNALRLFRERVGALVAQTGPTSTAALGYALGFESRPLLAERLGTTPAVRVLDEVLVTLRERLAALEPDNTTYLRDLTLSYENLAGLDTVVAPERAREAYLKSLAIREGLAALEPDNATYLRDLTLSYNNLAGLDRVVNPGHAREVYQKSLAITERLAALEPDNTTYLRDLTLSYTNLAGFDEVVDPARARAAYVKSLAIAERLVARDPDNRTYLRDLTVSYDNLARLDKPVDPARARGAYLKSFAIAERLAALEPDNTTYLRDLSVSYDNLAGLDKPVDPERAREAYLKSLAIREWLAALEPVNITYLRDLAVSYSMLAGLDDVGPTARAPDWREKLLDVARRLAALESDNQWATTTLRANRWATTTLRANRRATTTTRALRDFTASYEVTGFQRSTPTGDVYAARRREDGLPVAVKVLSPTLVEGVQFERISRLLRRIDHISVTRVLALGRTARGGDQGYVVTEWVEGEVLSDVIEDSGPLDPEGAATLAGRVARALQGIHDQGLVHGDLAPTCVLLCRAADGSEAIKISDVALNLLYEESADRGHCTFGGRLRAPTYWAPELVEGYESDHQSDIYALGVMLFEMLTGIPPFVGRPMAVMAAIVESPMPTVSDRNPTVPLWMDHLVAHMTARDRDERLPSARSVVEAVEAGLGRTVSGG